MALTQFMTSKISKDWKEQIWIPPLYFSNTNENKELLSGSSNRIEVIKQGEPIPNDISDVDEENVFIGDDNHLEFHSTNDLTFECHFELSKFPFDNQYCSIHMKFPQEWIEYTFLHPKHIIYLGE